MRHEKDPTVGAGMHSPEASQSTAIMSPLSRKASSAPPGIGLRVQKHQQENHHLHLIALRRSEWTIPYREPEKSYSQQLVEEEHLNSLCAGVAHQLSQLLTFERGQVSSL